MIARLSELLVVRHALIQVQLRVTGGGPSYVDTIVDVGGKVSNRKGVNVPDVVLPIPALTAKDREDAAYGLELGVDWMALSFVQRPEVQL